MGTLKCDRYSAPQPAHTYIASGKDLAKNQEVAEHVRTVAPYVARHLKNGDKIVDIGCGHRPVTAFALKRRADELSDVEITGLDLFTEDDRLRRQLQKEVHARVMAQFRFVTCDINGLKPGAAPDFIPPEIDVAFLGGILPYIDLGEPIDFLLGRMRSGSRMIVANPPDARWRDGTRPPRGRLMENFLVYFAQEGRLTDHAMCGYSMKEVTLKEIMTRVVKQTLQRRQRMVDPACLYAAIREECGKKNGRVSAKPMAVKNVRDDINIRVTVSTREGSCDYSVNPIDVDGTLFMYPYEAFTVEL